MGYGALRHGALGRRLAVAAIAIAASTSGAAPAEAALTNYKPAVITSVDGPRHLTLQTTGGGVLKVRLGGVDGPNAGECGADGSRAALTRMSKKYSGRVYFQLALDGKARARGADGMFLAELTYRPKPQRYGQLFGARLFDLGWVQQGTPETANAAERAADEDFDGANNSESDGFVGRPRRGGLWDACGGALHAPVGQTPPAAQTQWVIEATGVTRSIGPLVLPSTLAPGAELTVGAVAQAFGGLDITAGKGGCIGVSASYAVSVTSIETTPGTPCARQNVFSISSIGPRPVSTHRAVATGLPVRTLLGQFDAVTDRDLNDADPGDWVWLGPGGWVPWAWQTGAEVGATDQILGFVTTVITGVTKPGD